MESSRILVTELPEGMSETDLTIYFQSTRESGGGDVRDIQIDKRQAIVTFEDVHGSSDHCETCFLISFADPARKQNGMESSRVVVTRLPEGISKTDLTIYFQSARDSGGGDVRDIQIVGNQAFITFHDVEAAARVVGRSKHYFKNHRVVVCLLPEAAEPSDPVVQHAKWSEIGGSSFKHGHAATNTQFAEYQPDPQIEPYGLMQQSEDFNGETRLSHKHSTIKVTGLPERATEDLVTNYFENAKRSKGGPVSNVVINPDSQTCKVTFESPDDALRVVEHSPHSLSGALLQVSMFDESEEDNQESHDEDVEELEEGVTIIISGISPSTTEDAVCNYFENSRRSGGGEVDKIEFNVHAGEAVITFLEVIDRQRLLEGEHSINKTPITVKLQPPKKKVPPDPVRIHVQGLSEKTTEDCLCFYLEKFSGVDVEKVYFGTNNNALVVFDYEPDFQTLIDKVRKDTKGLEGKKPRLERVAVCTSILVTGLREESSDDTIQLYFENEKRSGGKDVSKVERIWKDKAVVFFEDPSCVQKVIQRKQALEGKTLNVTPHYPFLQDTTTMRVEMKCDPEVFEYIQMNHESELQVVLEENKIQIEISEDSQVQAIVVSSVGNKKDCDRSWEERVNHLESFLQSFQRSQFDIASEIFDEIEKRWGKCESTEESPDFLVSFDDHKRIVKIIGKTSHVDKEWGTMKELIQTVQQDTELMKTVVQVVEDDIPTSKLKLLEMSGICERLRDKHRHLNIAVDSNGQKLLLKGPRSLLQEVKVEVFTFILKIVERTIELPEKLINVLKSPPVSSFLQNLLTQRGICAVVLYGHGQSSNEVKVVGIDSSTAKKAENVLQDTTLEKSYHLTPENLQLLGSRRWRDFQTSVAPRLKVGITVDSTTIWVCGIDKDVQECFEEVKAFLEKNTILHTIVPAEYGMTKFIFEVWKSKVEAIKEELVDCSIDMGVSADSEGIEVSGTSEGLKKCLPQVKDLISAVQKDSLPIDRPGMKKYFLKGKGPIVLKATEEKHHCIVLSLEQADNEEKLAHGTMRTKAEDDMDQEPICSYLTNEEKKISVIKGDITKDYVDVIVNAANGELNHIGGLAASIVRAGGKEIQDDCKEYVRLHGPLLEGQTMVSTAGRLPCHKVIHAVGPKWDSMADKQVKEGDPTVQERYLKFAITNSMKEATDYRSIAIPAVSSGVFGFPRDLCAKVILDAVLDFCRENPYCKLSEIHLINNDDTTVCAFAEQLRKRFAGEKKFKEQVRPTAFGLRTKTKEGGWGIPKSPRSLTTKGIRITVKVGDLAQEQADAIIGTAASNLNLNQNPCANALSQAAGPSLQQECANIGSVAVGDIVVNTQTGNLKCRAVIFAICSEWDSGKGRKVLKRLLTKCLQAASVRGMTSIAFPAIGTGTLQFPRAEVAKIYFDEVMSYNQKNPSTSIKEARFVLYNQDTPTIQAFDAELKKRMENNAPLPMKKHAESFEKWSKNPGKEFRASPIEKAAFSPLRERDDGHLETNVGSLCFKVHPGDITKETTDAIVVISNKDLDLRRGGGAGAAILKAGGQSIQYECSQKGTQVPGSVVITRGGNLKANFIFHIVPHNHLNEKTVKASIERCLEEAEKHGLSSISFPAIGTGNLGIPPRESASTMLSAIRDFSDQQPTSMQLVNMVIFQDEMMKDVRAAIEEASGETSEKPGFLQRIASRVGDFLGLADSADKKGSSAAVNLREFADKKLDLIIFAGCKVDLQKAVDEINEIMADNSTKQKIEREAITKLSKQHLQRIHTLELRYDVKASVEKEVGRIVVSGQTEDILVVVGEIYKILDQVKEDEHERKRAEAVAKDIQWTFKEAGVFKEFELNLNAKIEAAYDNKKATVALGEDGHKIDFKSMTVRDRSGDDVTEVKRIDRRGMNLPKHWTPQPKDHKGKETTVYLHQLDPTKDAQEYQKVQKLFQQSCGNNIDKIERVQNPALYGTYAIRRQKMDEAKGSNEKLLFHGTPGDNCLLINHTGFNRSFHGKNATAYGNGVYFALNASYSARSTYSPPDINGFRYMYLTRVLVGEYTVGRSGLLTPPPKNPSDPTDTYDSVVDQDPNPGIFVVFYDWQCYPEYLITFQ